MIDPTQTRLLDRLEDPSDQTAWREFDRRYREAMWGFARRLGLAEDDARDVTQEAIVAFVQDFRAGKYERTRGRVGAWLFAMVRSRVARQMRQRGNRRDWRGQSAIDALPDDRALSDLWEEEWRRALLRTALDQLRTETRMGQNTLAAFEAVAIEGRAVAEVAVELSMTENAIYTAKFRATQRLRQILEALERADVLGLEEALEGPNGETPDLGPTPEPDP